MDACPEEEEQGYGNGRLFAEGGAGASSLWGFGYGHHDLCYVVHTNKGMMVVHTNREMMVVK